jgi:Holliday junction resolvasome RuvABC ATP-dependent DNA helicase subunit
MNDQETTALAHLFRHEPRLAVELFHAVREFDAEFYFDQEIDKETAFTNLRRLNDARRSVYDVLTKVSNAAVALIAGEEVCGN